MQLRFEAWSEDSRPRQARRSKGSKKTAKKEAIVTAVDSVAPGVRDSQNILQALLPDTADAAKPTVERPEPSNKQTGGTLDGKTAAIRHLAPQVAQGECSQVGYRVALTDGCDAWQQQRLDPFPDFTLVLDIIHVTQDVWQAANARWGEPSPERLPCIQQALAWLLQDHLDDLLNPLDAQVSGLSSAQQLILARVSAYLRRNRPFMACQR